MFAYFLKWSHLLDVSAFIQVLVQIVMARLSPKILNNSRNTCRFYPYLI